MSSSAWSAISYRLPETWRGRQVQRAGAIPGGAHLPVIADGRDRGQPRRCVGGIGASGPSVDDLDGKAAALRRCCGGSPSCPSGCCNHHRHREWVGIVMGQGDIDADGCQPLQGAHGDGRSSISPAAGGATFPASPVLFGTPLLKAGSMFWGFGGVAQLSAMRVVGFGGCAGVVIPILASQMKPTISLIAESLQLFRFDGVGDAVQFGRERERAGQLPATTTLSPPNLERPWHVRPGLGM